MMVTQEKTSTLLPQFLIALILASFPLSAFGQNGPTLRAESQKRVTVLTADLRPDDAEKGVTISTEAREMAITQTHGEIDAYVSRAINPQDVDPKEVARNFKQILSAHTVSTEYSDPPAAFILDEAGERFLLIAYALGTGVHGPRSKDYAGGTSVTIRAYKIINGRFELADSTGSDMDGCELFIRQLHAPVSNEVWLLAWGGMTGSNGPGAFTVRIYAYNGDKFRTVWKPETFGGATASVTAYGFTLKHVDNEHSIPPGWLFVQDDYDLTPNGPQLISTSPVQ